MKKYYGIYFLFCTDSRLCGDFINHHPNVSAPYLFFIFHHDTFFFFCFLGRCSKMLREAWTWTESFPLCTARTAANSPPTTSSSCWLTSESETSTFLLSHLYFDSSLWAHLVVHTLLDSRDSEALFLLSLPCQAWEEQASDHPWTAKCHHWMCPTWLLKYITSIILYFKNPNHLKNSSSYFFSLILFGLFFLLNLPLMYILINIRVYVTIFHITFF